MDCKPGAWKVAFTVAALLAAPRVISAQQTVCDEKVRADFAQAVAEGASEAELEAKFGYCRSADKALARGAQSASKVLSVTNFNTFFERMNGCGYQPQSDVIGCDVEIRRLGGYGRFPAGSFEHVRFCFDCDDVPGFEFTTVGSVHVTDNVAPLPTPSWFHMAFASTFPAATCRANNGRQANARAILSWAAVPPNCNSVPFWGNRFDFTIRRDP